MEVSFRKNLYLLSNSVLNAQSVFALRTFDLQKIRTKELYS